jgi:hypothetical protein
MAVGTITFKQSNSGRFRSITATCTASSTDGSFPATNLPGFSGRLVALRTNPGATAPTASYDITLVDEDGLDRLQGVGADRHTSNSEHATIVYSGTSVNPLVTADDTLALTLANNSVNSAITVVTIVYEV